MMVAVLFGLVGIAYGVTVRAIERASGVPRLMAEGIKQIAPVLVLFFAIAQFLAYFDWSNIGDLLSAESARILGDGRWASSSATARTPASAPWRRTPSPLPSQ
ncbi:AbgT family transporter [Kribbella sp. NPDC004138]